ncbi:cobalt transporter CbiM [Chloroflexota bacterium]
MHIPDGLVSMPVIAAGYGVAAAATAYSIYRINKKENPREDVPKASLLTAAFFVASWIHIPLGPTSVHLVLSGMMGAILGYFAFPAILIGLFFQAVMFGHGGLTTLGINACIMGLPAIVAHFIFRLRRFGDEAGRAKTGIHGFLAGGIAIAISIGLFILVAVNSISATLDAATEQAAIYTLAVAHLALIPIEGAITAMLAVFLLRVKPQILEGV